MTLLYCDPCFLKHETGPHPERGERIARIPERLQRSGLSQRCAHPQWQPVTPQRLARVHTPQYKSEVWSFAKLGGGYIDDDTVISPESHDVALLAVGAVCDATERLIRGEDTSALCLVRPPGHHALVDRAMGFCIFNNVAVAARMAADEYGLDRVLIVDWDVHHGNGTQAMFWDDPNVAFFSIHRWPFYPGTGAEEERGVGDAVIVNRPVELGISRRDYLALFSTTLEDVAAQVKPQLVFVSAGFDTHRLDPVGSLGLETEDFILLTRDVMEAAQSYAGGKVVSVLEGGYDPEILADCVEVHLSEMLARTPAADPRA